MNKVRMIVFTVVTLVSGIIYLYTMSPTVAFWDCGEFIAASYGLGVPHPPGTPLYILMGRVFSVIPIGSVAQRVTFMSVLFTALSAGFMYLLIERIMKRVASSVSAYIRHASAAFGSLVGAFSFSVWFSAVEAEVYGMSGFVMVLMVWLALVWGDRFKEGSHSTWRWVMLLAYIGALSVGIHLEPILVLIGLFIYALWMSWGREESRDLIMTFLFLIFVLMGSYLLIKLNVERVGAGRVVPVVVGIFGAVFLYLAYRWSRRYSFRRILGVMFLVVVGLSGYLYLMVRAHLNPSINESDPRSVAGLWEVFSRKQYGENNPFNRRIAYPEMWNEGEDLGFSNLDAFVHDTRIFFSYFSWQYTPFARDKSGGGMVSLWVTMVYIAVGLVGLVRMREVGNREFVMVLVTFLLLSAGLIFYLNMRFIPSDPSYLRPQEVRERDYFYGSAYQWWGVFVAFGLMWMSEAFGMMFKRRGLWGKVVCSAAGVILVATPIMGNWRSRANRHGDWMADDYGYNILMSCSRPGILFTNGDNDTFPLWFQQEVIGTRKYDSEADTGVIVANFSLLNTNWYIKQIHEQGFPISFSRAFRGWAEKGIPVLNSNNFYRFDNPALEPWNDYVYKKYIKGDAEKERIWVSMGELQKMEYAIEVAQQNEDSFEDWLLNEISIGMAVEFIPVRLASRGGAISPVEVLLPKDMTVRSIVCAVNGVEFTDSVLFMDQQEFADFAGSVTDPFASHCVYFSSTCSQENMLRLEPWMVAEGLVYRVTDKKTEENKMMYQSVNYPYTESLYNQVFRFRGIFAGEMLDEKGRLDTSKIEYQDIKISPNTLYDDEFARLASNYAAGFFMMGTNEIRKYENREVSDPRKALLYMKIGHLISRGNEMQFTYYLVEAYKISGMKEEAISTIEWFISEMENKLKMEYLPAERERAVYSLGFFTAKKVYTLLYFGEDQEARKVFLASEEILRENSLQDYIILQSLFSFRENDRETAKSVLENAGLYSVDYDFVKEWIDQGVLKETGDTQFAEFVLNLYVQNSAVLDSIIQADSSLVDTAVR